MIVLNFSHPLIPEQIARIAELAGQPAERTIEVISQFDDAHGYAAQAATLADSCGLSEMEWQTVPLVVVPPALSFIAVTLLAQLHGRMGYFPTCARLRPTPEVRPLRYEVVELLDLQTVRSDARRKR